MKRRLVFLMLLVTLISCVFPGCSKALSMAEKYKNSLDEIYTNIFGLIDRQEDYVYYVGGNRYNLYKMKIDGTSKKKLSGDECEIIGIKDNFVYYYKINGQKAICRVSIDGKQKSCLVQTMVMKQSLSGDWIYYITDGYEVEDNLCRISLDGKNIEKIIKDNVNYYIVNEDWIYYVNCDDRWTLYKIKIDGTSKTKLSDDRIISEIAIGGDRLYYVSESDNKRLYSIRIDGGDKKTFTDYSDKENAARYSGINSIQIHGDILYFVQGRRIYSVNLDGTDWKSICDTFSYDFVVDKKWIYTYLDPRYTIMARFEIGE